jgi:hypothetical protein
MVESMLRASGRSTGLFTSPHLCDVRERVRVNGQLVSKEVFEEHFWRCHDALAAAATPEVGMPGYFRFLTLLGGCWADSCCLDWVGSVQLASLLAWLFAGWLFAASMQSLASTSSCPNTHIHLAADRAPAHRHPPPGLSIFLSQKIDVVILEVGIGGRLDATNGADGVTRG